MVSWYIVLQMTQVWRTNVIKGLGAQSQAVFWKSNDKPAYWVTLYAAQLPTLASLQGHHRKAPATFTADLSLSDLKASGYFHIFWHSGLADAIWGQGTGREPISVFCFNASLL